MATAIYKFKWFKGGTVFWRMGYYRVPIALKAGEPPRTTTAHSAANLSALSLASSEVREYLGALGQDWSYLLNDDPGTQAAAGILGLSNCYFANQFSQNDTWVFASGAYIKFTNIVTDSTPISGSHRSSTESVDYQFYDKNGNAINGMSGTWSAYASSYNETNYPPTQGMKLLPWTYGYSKICISGNQGLFAIYNKSPNYCNITNLLYIYTQSNIDASIFFDGIEPADTDNPYEDAGTSGESDGGGNFSEDSDSVEEDAMPTLSAVGTGFATLFTPSQSQLKNLADIMWGSQWWQAIQNEVQGIDKMFVSLGVVPFTVTAGSTVEVTWLGMSITEVYLTLAANQYFEFDMGSIDLSNDSRIWDSKSAMDYGPFSKLGIYLPFIGFQELDIDECRDATVQLKYRIDALTGSVVALVKIAGNTIYQFTGNCMTQIPITSQSYDELFSTVTNVAIAGSNVKTAGALAGGGDNVAAEAYTREKNPITEVQGKYQVMQHAAQVSHAENSLASATANAISGLKPNYNKTGAVSASNSLFCVKQPYLFLTTPRVCIPEHLQKYGGFPANITDTLGNFEGFTVVNNIRLNNLVATSPEVQEIYDLLHEGVII